MSDETFSGKLLRTAQTMRAVGESMSKAIKAELPRFEHRNGETSAPTIYETNYWFRCNSKADPDDGPEDGLVYLLTEGEQRFTDALGDFYSLNDVSGQWYGPVTPPWEAK